MELASFHNQIALTPDVTKGLGTLAWWPSLVRSESSKKSTHSIHTSRDVTVGCCILAARQIAHCQWLSKPIRHKCRPPTLFLICTFKSVPSHLMCRRLQILRNRGLKRVDIIGLAFSDDTSSHEKRPFFQSLVHNQHYFGISGSYPSLCSVLRAITALCHVGNEKNWTLL